MEEHLVREFKTIILKSIFIMFSTFAITSLDPESAVAQSNTTSSSTDKTNDLLAQIRDKKTCVACDLSGVDLSNELLVGVDLQKANLANANLSGARLSDSNLSNADLTNANFSDAILNRANFTSSILHSTNLSGARLYEAIFTGADFKDADLSNAEFRNTDISNAILVDTNLTGASVPSWVSKGAIFCRVTEPNGSLIKKDCDKACKTDIKICTNGEICKQVKFSGPKKYTLEAQRRGLSCGATVLGNPELELNNKKTLPNPQTQNITQPKKSEDEIIAQCVEPYRKFITWYDKHPDPWKIPEFKEREIKQRKSIVKHNVRLAVKAGHVGRSVRVTACNWNFKIIYTDNGKKLDSNLEILVEDKHLIKYHVEECTNIYAPNCLYGLHEYLVTVKNQGTTRQRRLCFDNIVKKDASYVCDALILRRGELSRP